MRETIIHDLPDWQVLSWGNGMSYLLASRKLNRAVFFQGDDAAIFRDSLDALTESRSGPMLDYKDALACIWSDYAECAENWGVRGNDQDAERFAMGISALD